MLLRHMGASDRKEISMITVNHLTKCYGNCIAVDDLSFEIQDGHIYGVLGSSGAGKSTIMNIIAGCLPATKGWVYIDGCDIFNNPMAVRRLIGYFPEHLPLLCMNDTPTEYLQSVGEAKGMKGADLQKQIDSVIELTGIGSVRKRMISTLSKGYKQRVGVAQALLGNPKLIVLDEPTVGLNLIQTIEFHNLIRKLGEMYTILFSSHTFSEVQAVCEKVMLLSKGRLVAFDTPDNLGKLLKESNGIFFRVKAEKAAADALMKEKEFSTVWESTDQGDGTTSVCVKACEDDIRELYCRLFLSFSRNGMAIFEMTTKRMQAGHF